MAVLDFPSSPTVNQIATLTNGFSYQWDGAVWTLAAATGQQAGGDLTGTYPAPVIAPLAVTTAKISAGASVRGSVSVPLPANYLSGLTAAWTNVATTPAMTTRGGPVLLTLVVGGSLLTSATSLVGIYYGFYRDGVLQIGWFNKLQTATANVHLPTPGGIWLDTTATAASHTYGFWVLPGGAQLTTGADSTGQLVAMELA